MIVACLRCNRHIDTSDAKPGDTVKCSCGLALLVPEGPAEAGKMNCPSCGAPVDPKLHRCNFCDTALATVICPRCFGAVFQGSKHCAHCGEAVLGRTVIHGSETQHHCPRCQELLRVFVVEGKPLERCAKCEGMWVDLETIERIYKDREQTGSIQKVIQTSGAKTQPVEVKNDGYLKCPTCQTFMNRKNFGRFSGVLVDICSKHGTWFDADELRRVLAFITAGGLEKAAKREKEALEEEIRSLKSKRSSGGGGAMSADISLGRSLADTSGAEVMGRGIIAIAGAILKRLF